MRLGPIARGRTMLQDRFALPLIVADDSAMIKRKAFPSLRNRLVALRIYPPKAGPVNPNTWSESQNGGFFFFF